MFRSKLKLVTFCSLAAVLTSPAVLQAQQEIPVVTTLGTAGGPVLRPDRSQPATLITLSSHHYLVDAGEGVTAQLAKAHISPDQIDAIFISHLHADHLAGLPSLLFSIWIKPGRRALNIYGPPGTGRAVRDSLNFLSQSVELFRQELPPSYPKAEEMFTVHEIDGLEQAEVFHDPLVKVEAVENTHFRLIKGYAETTNSRSLSYRFNAGSHAIVVTGDSGPSEALEKLAQGAEMLVSEVISVPGIRRQLAVMAPNMDLTAMLAHMEQEHLTATAVAELATRANVKSVVLTHFSGEGGQIGAQELAREVSRQFNGTVIPAVDLGVYP